MNDSTQILVLAGVVAGYAAAGFVWLWERHARELRAIAACVRRPTFGALVAGAMVVCFVQRGSTKVTNGNDSAVSPAVAGRIGGEPLNRDAEPVPAGLRFTSIEVSSNDVAFAAAWTETLNLPEACIDLYATKDIGTNYWELLGYYDVGPSDTNLAGVVSFASLPFAPGDRLFLSLGTRADLDNDGLVDAREKRQFGTSPLLADSDGDGIPDGLELNSVPPLDPLAPDSDGDGYLDGEEVLSGTNPLSPDMGAGGTIRYYYDEDDRLLESHAGAAEASSRAEMSPAGNELKATLSGSAPQ